MLCIHDSKVESFIQPFFAPTLAAGQRMFNKAVNDPGTDFHQFPGDYTLFELGTFKQDDGTLDLLPSPKSHGNALIYKTPPISPQPLFAMTNGDVEREVDGETYVRKESSQ